MHFAAVRPLHLLELVPQATGEAVEQGVAAREHNVRQHEALHVFLDARDTLANLLVEARKSALSAQAGLEEHLGAPETLVANQDSAAVWHLIIHFASVGLF